MVNALNDFGEEGIRLAPLKDRALEKVTAAAALDEMYQALKETIINGFPEHCHELEHHLGPYWGVCSLLAVDDSLIVYGPRLLVPRSLRRETLAFLHDSHQRIDHTKHRARQTTYWTSKTSSLVVGDVVLSFRSNNMNLCSRMTIHRTECFSLSPQITSKRLAVLAWCTCRWPYVTPCPREASAFHLVKSLRAIFADSF